MILALLLVLIRLTDGTTTGDLRARVSAYSECFTMHSKKRTNLSAERRLEHALFRVVDDW
jgi:hypothetical protein